VSLLVVLTPGENAESQGKYGRAKMNPTCPTAKYHLDQKQQVDCQQMDLSFAFSNWTWHI